MYHYVREIKYSKYPKIKWVFTGSGVATVARGRGLVFNWHKILLNIEDNIVNLLSDNKEKREKFLYMRDKV